MFDKDAFSILKEDAVQFWTPYANTYETTGDNQYVPRFVTGQQNWEESMQGYITDNGALDPIAGFVAQEAMYADQIPPFDITVTMRNEYGHSAVQTLYGVEILNEGSGMSIDDITTEKACTFVARGIGHLHRV